MRGGPLNGDGGTGPLEGEGRGRGFVDIVGARLERDAPHGDPRALGGAVTQGADDEVHVDVDAGLVDPFGGEREGGCPPGGGGEGGEGADVLGGGSRRRS